jgi:NADH-quinone oxidoreductase subunit A
MTPTAIVAYLTLFVTVGVLFLFVALLLGRLLRPYAPSAEKLQTYECGEPAVGSSFVQYDLRFYVVALLFIVFEVELAFFFPPAVVFGKLTQIMAEGYSSLEPAKSAPNAQENQVNRAIEEKYHELGVDRLFPADAEKGPENSLLPLSGQALLPEQQRKIIETQSRILAAAAMVDISVFFAVLLVGFAYLWKRGDLEWVRAVRGFRIQGSGFKVQGSGFRSGGE